MQTNAPKTMATCRDELKQIAKLLGLDKRLNLDGSRVSVTPSSVVKAVADLVEERTKESATGKRKREARVHEVHRQIQFEPGKVANFIPLNGGFHWDERLLVALDTPGINKSFAEQFSFDFGAIGLKGGEEFLHAGKIYQVVGRQPKRPAFPVVAVERCILQNTDVALQPRQLRVFRRDVVG
jgi:hypothetical protein